MKITAKKISLLTLGLATLGCLSIGAVCANVSATAEANAAFDVELTMLKGANLRKDSSNPSLKFTAELASVEAGVEYGMLIIPADWLSNYTFNNDYIEVLNREVGANEYKNVVCTPYQDIEEVGTPEAPGAWRISATVNEAANGDYSVEYIAIAYATDGTNYDYATVDKDTHARSFTYVAQMAIQNEELTEEEIASLDKYVNYAGAEGVTSAQTYWTYSAATNSYDESQFTLTGSADLETASDKALRIDANALGFDKGCLSLKTKAYYFDVTQVSFKVKFDASWNEDTWTKNPEGVGYGWWGINYFRTYEETDIYTNMKTVSDVEKVNAEWQTVTLTFDQGVSGYLSIIAAVGEFDNPVMLVDDFTIISEGDVYTENFDNADLDKEGMFVCTDTREEAPVSIVSKAEAGLTMAAPTHSGMTISNVEEALLPMQSKNAYSNVTSIEYDVCVNNTLASGWGGFQMGYATGSSWDVGRVYEHFNGDNVDFKGGYIDYLKNLKVGETYHAVITVNGTAISATFTSESGDVQAVNGTLSTTSNLYLAFYHEVKGDGTYTISNFQVTADGKTETGVDNVFNGGETVTISSGLDTSYNFSNVLAAGKVADAFAKGTYAAVEGTEINEDGLEALAESAIVLTAKFGYTLKGEKEFAIRVGGMASMPEYLLINNNSLSFYKNTVKQGESISLTGDSNELTINVTKAGKLLVSINGDDANYLGKVSVFAALKVVGFGGAGTLSIDEVDSVAYSAESIGGGAKTFTYATYVGGECDGLDVNGATAEYAVANGALNIQLMTAVGAEGSKFAFATANAHAFTSISFDMYMPTLANKQENKWVGDFAFGASVSGDNYSGNGALDELVKGAWNHVEISVNNGVATFGSRTYALTGNDYFWMRINPGDGSFNSADVIKIENFTITDANGTYTDTFNDGTTSLLTDRYANAGFTFEESPASLRFTETKAPAQLGVLANAIGAHEVIGLQLKDTYSNVTEITFKAKYDNTVLVTDRWGLGIASTKGSYNYYSPQSFEFPMDNQWHEYRFEFTSSKMNMYLDGVSRGERDYNNASTYHFYIQICPKTSVSSDDAVLVYMDDFSITANGTTYTDDFSTGVDKLFDKATGRLYLKSIGETGNANNIDNVASVINELDSYIAGADFVLDGLKDNKKALNGYLSYAVEAGKEFAIVLGEDKATNSADFLYVTATEITFCKVENGVLTKGKSISATAVNTLQITLLKSGALSISNGLEMVAMGNVSNVKQFKMVDVNAKGTVTFSEIKLSTQKYVEA